ncbi:hypothetical protein ABT160_02645 [Streptomyces sp. NPDC001941]|uniref:hypothetical protein n=1 Tax=Streptomyces sp. NPDC001941 TaxID=3154659 RepID=UPI00331C23B2
MTRRNAASRGPVEAAVRDDIDQLGDLTGVEPSLTELAYTLAREVDLTQTGECEDCGARVPLEDSTKTLPTLSRELRQTLAALLEGRVVNDDDDGLGDLATPE